MATSFDFYKEDVRQFKDLNFLPVFALVDLQTIYPYSLEALEGKLNMVFEARFYDFPNGIPHTLTKSIPAKKCDQKDYDYDPKLLESFTKLSNFWQGNILCPENLEDIPMFGDHGVPNPQYLSIVIEKCTNPNAEKPWKIQTSCAP